MPCRVSRYCPVVPGGGVWIAGGAGRLAWTSSRCAAFDGNDPAARSTR